MENFKKEDSNENLNTYSTKESNKEFGLEKEKKALKQAKKIESTFRSFLIFVIALLVVLLINCWQTKREIMLMNNNKAEQILETNIVEEKEIKKDTKIDEVEVLNFYNCVDASQVDNRYFFVDGEDVKECFTPSGKSYIEEDLFKVALNARLEELSISCSVEAKGAWLPYSQECEHSDKDWCDNNGGEFNNCASKCRHEKASSCIDECVSVCIFNF